MLQERNILEGVLQGLKESSSIILDFWEELIFAVIMRVNGGNILLAHSDILLEYFL